MNNMNNVYIIKYMLYLIINFIKYYISKWKNMNQVNKKINRKLAAPEEPTEEIISKLPQV